MAEYENNVSYGMRINYIRDGTRLLSSKIYSNGWQNIRVIIDTEPMTFKLIDPVTAEVLYESTKKIKNLEVLQRHVKKMICEILQIEFDSESRKTKDE